MTAVFNFVMMRILFHNEQTTEGISLNQLAAILVPCWFNRFYFQGREDKMQEGRLTKN